jgi:hypothetical protein
MDMEGSCEYIEQAIADGQQGVARHLGVEQWIKNLQP